MIGHNPGRGLEAKYLGHRQWAVSMKIPRSLVMACPLVAGARDFPKAELPSAGIVEIPRGCSVQTDEWILQASHQYSMTSTKSARLYTTPERSTLARSNRLE
jgi:hypothetical protein